MNGSTLSSDTLRYGPLEDQHLLLSLPGRGVSPRGIVALVHGGYWRSTLNASLMEPLAIALVRDGWAVANIEYRRGDTGPWPAPLEDCRRALGLVRSIGREHGIDGPVVSLGHSVGGQLALLTADLADAVVALAPVTDAERTYHEGLGEHAALEYFGASPADSPETYRQASAVRQLPLHTPTLLVHGSNDARVPVGHSLDYFREAEESGSPVALREYAELSHLEDIDPSAAHWSDVASWMADVPTPAEARGGRTGN